MEAVLTSVPSGTHTCGMTTAARGKVVWTIIVKSIKIVKLRLTVDRYCPYRLAGTPSDTRTTPVWARVRSCQSRQPVMDTRACDTLAETGWTQDTEHQMSPSRRCRQLELRLNARVRPSQKQRSQSECPTVRSGRLRKGRAWKLSATEGEIVNSLEG